MSKPRLRSELTLFDSTNLVVGSIIGADIYVASSFGAGYSAHPHSWGRLPLES
ncbi:MAG: hypothetical protein ACETV0_06080 [Nitrososphaeria archaeon]